MRMLILGNFRLFQTGDLYLIPDIKINNTGSGVEILMSIDKSDLTKAEKYLEKKLSRHFKTEGKEVNKEKLSKLVSELIENAEKGHKKKESPQIAGKISLDFISQVMLYTKIAYELAIYHFDEKYINDPIANKLRLVIKNQEPDKTIYWQFPAEKQSYNVFFDDEHHWILFFHNVCFIKLFGLSALIEFTEKGSSFVEKEGVVYKFCYKTLSFIKLPLIEKISQTNQRTRSV